MQPTLVSPGISPSGPAANNPPRITALTVSSDRAEVGEEVTISASVTDDESPVNDLSYSWAATSGTIIGTGPVVKWKAPIGNPTPAAYRISLVVVDKYGVGEQSLEHRVTAESRNSRQ